MSDNSASIVSKVWNYAHVLKNAVFWDFDFMKSLVKLVAGGGRREAGGGRQEAGGRRQEAGGFGFAFSPGRAQPAIAPDGLQNPAPFLLPHHGFPDMLRACRAC